MRIHSEAELFYLYEALATRAEVRVAADAEAEDWHTFANLASTELGARAGAMYGDGAVVVEADGYDHAAAAAEAHMAHSLGGGASIETYKGTE